MKILIIEDEKNIAESLKMGLEQHRFAVDVAYSGEDGYNLLHDYEYDIIILDLMLPDIEGEKLCKRIREEKIDCYILMLTAKKQVEDIVDGLNHGADDYLTKPFEFSELLARLRTLLRRSLKEKENNLRAGNIKIDLDKEQVYSGKKEIRLTKKEYMVLEYLLRNKGQLISRNQILEHAWDRNVDIFTNVVDSHIKNLRRKLGRSSDVLESVYGLGYRIKDDTGSEGGLN